MMDLGKRCNQVVAFVEYWYEDVWPLYEEDGKLEDSVYDALSNECPIQRKGRFLRWEELLSGRT